jgi:hypothetical protein
MEDPVTPPTINISARARFVLYLLGTLGSALVAYAVTKGWIGDAEVALWAVIAGVLTTLAAANVSPAAPALHGDQTAGKHRRDDEHQPVVDEDPTADDEVESQFGLQGVP